MGRITEELLRKRSEHNEGVLSTMEEVSLHQMDIERIENLEYYCRHLKILYLQNNIIEKLENLDKLKELEYLNLAVNSVQVIENLEKCESLNKLDLTMNFVDIENLKQSAETLSKVHSIREVYLTGNGCEDFKYFKEYIIAKVPQLTLLDGNEIFKSQRIKATQMLPMIEEELEQASEEHMIFKENDPNKNNPNKYSVEYRRKLYKELEAEKLKREEEKNAKPPNAWDFEEKKEPPSVYNAKGEIRQCNQGKYEFKMDEDIYKTAMMTFELKLPKHLDTNKVKVDLNPQYIRIDTNGKIGQWKLDYEIIVEKATIERSTTTGALLIKAPIVGYKPKEQPKKEKPKNKIVENKPQELKALKKGIDFDDDIKNDNKIQIVESFDKKEDDIEQLKKEFGIDVNDDLPDLD